MHFVQADEPLIPTDRTHKGLQIFVNSATGHDCVKFRKLVYRLDVIDQVRAECIRDAAPDMLAALRLVWNSIDRVNHPAAVAVQAAIAKAEGTDVDPS